MATPPAKTSSPRDIQAFIKRSQDITTFVAKHPRILFAVDATASRQPTWDIARTQQQAMFKATSAIATLSVQLCYYRGFHDFRAGPWLADSERLSSAMASVTCEGGHTQIRRLLKHAQKEHRQKPLRAVVFIGDAVEENPDSLCDLAGQCGLLALPLFIFQEGSDPLARATLSAMARLSHGAYARFDHHSAELLAQLLGAVASYAAGGRKALNNNPNAAAKILLQQLS